MINLVLLYSLSFQTATGDGSSLLTPIRSEAIFQFKSTELLRFSLHDCPANISSRSHVFPKGTVLSILAEQNSSTKVYYQMDGAPEQPYLETIRLVARGEHVITMWIRSGNDSILNSIKFKVVE